MYWLDVWVRRSVLGWLHSRLRRGELRIRQILKQASPGLELLLQRQHHQHYLLHHQTLKQVPLDWDLLLLHHQILKQVPLDWDLLQAPPDWDLLQHV